nr:MAG TPA: hypothetical protein [Caudoviricetes sp.]
MCSKLYSNEYYIIRFDKRYNICSKIRVIEYHIRRLDKLCLICSKFLDTILSDLSRVNL